MSPALRWDGLPRGTAALALWFEDPDAPAGVWTHWLWWDAEATATGIGEGKDAAAIGATTGSNSWRKPGYGGPCPPRGTHRYVLHLYALSQRLGLAAGADAAAFHKALQGKALAEASLEGTYTRS